MPTIDTILYEHRPFHGPNFRHPIARVRLAEGAAPGTWVIDRWLCDLTAPSVLAHDPECCCGGHLVAQINGEWHAVA